MWPGYKIESNDIIMHSWLGLIRMYMYLCESNETKLAGHVGRLVRWGHQTVRGCNIDNPAPPCTGKTFSGWFSMSPLPRLHHHDIITIVGLFFILGLLHHATTKFFSHTLTKRKKKKGIHSLALALTLTLTATLRPDHSTTMHCCWLQCKFATFNAPHYAVQMVHIYIYDVLTVRK